MRPITILTSKLIRNQLVRDHLRTVSTGQASNSNPDQRDHVTNTTRRARDGSGGTKVYFYGSLVGFGLVASATAYKQLHAFAREKSSNNQGSKDEVFTRDEVAKHDSLENGVWITYKGRVYDITNFVKHHPGGSHTIMMGAGGDVEPFWQTYTVHHANEVQNLLAQYEIGTLSQEDQQKELQQKQVQQKSEFNPYDNDPKRSPLLNVLTKQPFNAETPAKLLTPTYLTPSEVFFVRNHLPVPEVDLADYKLSICVGTDADPDNLKTLAEFSLDELKTKFKPHSVDCIIQCTGNRRSDLKKFKEIKGLDWKVGAISNARWTGVKLVDLLDYLGVKRDSESIRHVQMEGLDCDMTGQSYGSSISADYAFDSNKSVILAYEMNGQPLTRDHGFPLRFIAPGVTGARNVKWLGRIILSHEESNSHWQQKDYKSFSPNIDLFNVKWEQSASVQETPVQSAICDPADGEDYVIDESNGESATIPIRGYAYSGGGKMIIRVDLSIDGGLNWLTANLLDVPTRVDGTPDFTDRNKVYSWTRWTLDVPIPDDLKKSGSGSMEILCRAFDSAYNTQPERPDAIWNVRGILNNSWHKIKFNIRVKPNTGTKS